MRLSRYTRHAEGYVFVAETETIQEAHELAQRKGQGSYQIRTSDRLSMPVQLFFVGIDGAISITQQS